MNVRRLLTVAVAALMLSAGAGAAAAGTGGTNASAATDADLDTYDADAGYDDGTVTFAVTTNGSGVEGLAVAVDNESVGTTDADGRVTFETNESEFTVTVTGENVTGEFVYSVENGSLTLGEGEFEYADGTADDDEDENETRGPPDEMPEQADDRVRDIHAVINAYLDGDLDENTTLGEALHDVASGDRSPQDVGAPADAGRPADVGPSDEDDDENGEEDEDRGRPDDAGPPHDDDGGDAENDEDDSEADDDGEEGDDDDDRGNGNGNGRP